MEYAARQERENVFMVMERRPESKPAAAAAEKDGRTADVIGFTSGTGGSGTSSTALMLARNYAELCGMDVAYLSLDLLSSKACWQNGPSSRRLFELLLSGDAPDTAHLFVRDTSGVSRLPADGPRNPLTLADGKEIVRILESLLPCFDKIIVDVPASCSQAPGVLDVCDSIVVCYGWQDKLYGPSEELYLMLSEIHGNVQRFFSFHDEDEPDLYGQLGSEVRRLAKEI